MPFGDAISRHSAEADERGSGIVALGMSGMRITIVVSRFVECGLAFRPELPNSLKLPEWSTCSGRTVYNRILTSCS